jgi:hypothetical protein
MTSFKVKYSELNTSNLNNLAASLTVALSANGSTGPVINNLNVGALNLNTGNITLNSGYVIESAVDSLTATGSSQATALQLNREINRISNASNTGSPFSGVLLPASVAGLTVILVNSSSNSIQVYGNGNDTINDIVGATGVTQISNSEVEYACPLAGKWYTDGIGVGYAGSLVTDSFADGLTANAGGGQANATSITTTISRITNVANIGDSIKLPPAVPGLDLIVMNHGAKSIQVFGSGNDTVDDVSSTFGVPQMIGSVTIYACVTAGKWYSNGIGTGFAAGLPTISFTDNLTAHAGGGFASGTVLTSAMNRITSVANNGDSVLLPPTAPGLSITVVNATTGSIQVFGTGTDSINGNTFATGVSQLGNSVMVYESVGTGAWYVEGIGAGFAGSFPTVSYATITGVGGANSWATSTPITTVMVRVLGTGGVGLPGGVPTPPGLQITVVNANTGSVQVFPQSGDTIDGLGSRTITGAKTANFYSLQSGIWHALISS